MRISYKTLLILIFAFAGLSLSYRQSSSDDDVHKLWLDCRLKDVVSFEVFNKAMLGYRQIDNLKKKNLITIIDFSKPSTENRFFVIDLDKKQLLYKCYVAHGKNSGDNYAKTFSNATESLKSSLGFNSRNLFRETWLFTKT